MKRLIALLLIFIMLCSGSALSDEATPTDLEEYYTFEDDDFGYISVELLKRKVYLEFLKEPTYYGEEVTLVAVLVDFRDDDIYHFEWEESEDGETWQVIVGAYQSTYTFIIDHDNATHYWRVKVYLEED